MSKISVIIPVYNVMPYLEKALTSICEQTLEDLQIIVVDDGSTDGSSRIIDLFARKDHRILVLRQKNSGVSAARNNGLRAVDSEYVVFMDADDYVESDMLAALYVAAIQSGCDLLMSGFYFETPTAAEDPLKFPMCFQDGYYPDRKSFGKDFVRIWDKHLLYNICNKLYKTKIIKDHHLEFPSLQNGEDLKFNERYLQYCYSFTCLKNCYYHYVRERSGSSTAFRKNWFSIRVQEHEDLSRCFDGFDIHTAESREFLSRRFVERAVGCIENEFENPVKTSSMEKIQNIEKILVHPYTREALKYARPRSKKMKLMLIPVKWNSCFLCYCMGSLIHIVRKRDPQLFTKLKQER